MKTTLESTASDLALFREEVLKGKDVKDVNGNLSAVLVPAGYKVESIEKLSHGPWRMRAIVAADCIAEFSAYVNEHANAYSRVFVDPQKLEALAVLDYGAPHQPQWGEHRAHCRLRLDECYADLLRLATGSALDTERLVDFVLDHPDACEFTSVPPEDQARPEDYFSVPQAVQTLRKIKTRQSRDSEHDTSDTNRSRSTLERAAVTSAVPLTLRVQRKPAEGLDKRAIDVRLRYYLDGDKPLVSMRVISRGSLDQAIAEDFRTKLREALIKGGGGVGACPVHVGTLASFQ